MTTKDKCIIALSLTCIVLFGISSYYKGRSDMNDADAQNRHDEIIRITNMGLNAQAEQRLTRMENRDLRTAWRLPEVKR